MYNVHNSLHLTPQNPKSHTSNYKSLGSTLLYLHKTSLTPHSVQHVHHPDHGTSIKRCLASKPGPVPRAGLEHTSLTFWTECPTEKDIPNSAGLPGKAEAGTRHARSQLQRPWQKVAEVVNIRTQSGILCNVSYHDGYQLVTVHSW